MKTSNYIYKIESKHNQPFWERPVYIGMFSPIMLLLQHHGRDLCLPPCNTPIIYTKYQKSKQLFFFFFSLKTWDWAGKSFWHISPWELLSLSLVGVGTAGEREEIFFIYLFFSALLLPPSTPPDPWHYNRREVSTSEIMFHVLQFIMYYNIIDIQLKLRYYTQKTYHLTKWSLLNGTRIRTEGWWYIYHRMGLFLWTPFPCLFLADFWVWFWEHWEAGNNEDGFSGGV